ncbi:17826_t:CDS:2 [Funneliformis geosporum]|uniref:Signal peptidase complex subunit 1 n=1 Tax=Funneliformis geosporum TaxID=1117311 RepID=A0A9W4WR30_9GLOM|nr:17826_t:CDS:2 [Funneliformis geosporum]CAI2180025.1 2453_t:CDS:2 [Funneliformis geosporum]
MSSSWFELKFDFEGQKLAEFVSQAGIILFAVIGFVVGFLLQDILLTFQIFAGGIIVTSILVLPSWSLYNKHPVQWLPPIQNENNQKTLEQKESNSKPIEEK